MAVRLQARLLSWQACDKRSSDDAGVYIIVKRKPIIGNTWSRTHRLHVRVPRGIHISLATGKLLAHLPRPPRVARAAAYVSSPLAKLQ